MTNFLTEVREIIARETKAISTDKNVIEDFSLKVISSIEKECSGFAIYIPKRHKKELRDKEILKRFNSGKNINQLCRDYDLCAHHIRRIINKQKKTA
jgi:Mor family transcriptional regulator